MKDLEDFKKYSNNDQRNQMNMQLGLPLVSPPGKLIRFDKDGMEKLINKLREGNNYQNLANVLQRLQLYIPKLENKSCFDTNKLVLKADAIEQLIEASLKLIEEEITTHELKIASFNLNEGLLEAAPQALLQTSIQMRDGKFFNCKSTAMEMITVILSLISMSFASGTM